MYLQQTGTSDTCNRSIHVFNPLGSAMFITSLNSQVRLKCRYNL